MTILLTGIRQRLLLGLFCGLLSGSGLAGDLEGFDLLGKSVKDRANGALALLGYVAIPDMTTSSLSIDSGSAGSIPFQMTQFAGGFTVSDEVPLYLEGGIGISRYDPKYIASDGQEERIIPIKWNSLAGTVGAGWDFAINEKWTFRPMGNFTLGHVESDSSLLARLLEIDDLEAFQFLKDGRLSAYGLGASVMLDYEDYQPDYEVDVELRLTHLNLHSWSNSSEAVEGSAVATTAALWSRYRAPTGYQVLDRPLRYVLEGSYSNFMGDQRGALGFSYLTQLGVGLELDTSSLTRWVSRVRAVARFVFGDNVRGYSLGLAASF